MKQSRCEDVSWLPSEPCELSGACPDGAQTEASGAPQTPPHSTRCQDDGVIGSVTERRLHEVVDIARIPIRGTPSRAVLRVPAFESEGTDEIECDVLVVGGGTGGVAAAVTAARRGRTVCLVEETDWLGGQLTAQGVAALDEHDEIERFGGTATYYELRRLIRSHYEALGPQEPRPDLNPGSCWVTRLAFEPRVAVTAIDTLLEPLVEAGRLRVFLRAKPVAAVTNGTRIGRVSVMDLDTARVMHFRPDFVIDATELGDLLPLAGIAYRTGAESMAETGEPHAQPGEARPQCVQSFTYTFALERMPGGSVQELAAPPRYEHYRESQPYGLTIEVHGGEIYSEESGWLEYRLFEAMPGTKGSLWTYRRLIDAALLPNVSPRDISMINWPGTDYRDHSILDLPASETAAALQDAKRVSLGFLYWLQTAAPCEGARVGAPELRLRPDVMGTIDGLSKHPYIREARRIHALKTVVEQDVAVEFQPGDRAAHFSDAIGVGWYPIDIHRSGPDDVGISTRTRPFQVPLGALIPIDFSNVAAAAKNIGTTHITNGCYRLHPVEWNIGEAAGALAAWSLETGDPPQRIWRDPLLLARFQRSLLEQGVPLAWIVDVPVNDPGFSAVQTLYMEGYPICPSGLEFAPSLPTSPSDWQTWGGHGAPPRTRAEAAQQLLGERGGSSSRVFPQAT
jgi:hypothetical protein